MQSSTFTLPLGTALKGASRNWPLIAALLMLVLIALADYLSGYEVRLAVLYLLPISVATWSVGAVAGMSISALAVACWGVSFRPSHHYSSEVFYYWEGAVLACTFFIMVILLNRLQKALGAADKRFKDVLEGLAAYVYVTGDQSGKILYANRQLEDLIGERLTGQPESCISKCIRETSLRTSADTDKLSLGSFSYAEVEYIEAGRIFNTQSGPIQWQGRVPAHLHILTEITAQKEAASLRVQHREMIDKASRSALLAEIASMLGHELNQPLMAVATYNSAGKLFLQQEPPDIVATILSLEKSEAQVARASEIVERTRSFLRRRTMAITETNINTVLGDAVQALELEARGVQVSIDDRATARLAPIPADATLIEQVVINLLGNALDAVGPVNEPKVHLSTNITDEGSVMVSVHDNGCGIDQAIGDKVYMPFFTTKTHGLGLGLSICRSIIEAHGGVLHYVSEPGKGATFSFSLPLMAFPGRGAS